MMLPASTSANRDSDRHVLTAASQFEIILAVLFSGLHIHEVPDIIPERDGIVMEKYPLMLREASLIRPLLGELQRASEPKQIHGGFFANPRVPTDLGEIVSRDRLHLPVLAAHQKTHDSFVRLIRAAIELDLSRFKITKGRFFQFQLSQLAQAPTLPLSYRMATIRNRTGVPREN